MEYVRTATWQHDTGASARLDYTGRSSALTVVGAAVDRVTIAVTLRIELENDAAADAALRAIADGIERDGDQVSITVPDLSSGGAWWPFGRSVHIGFSGFSARISYLVTVPHQTRCQISSQSGPVAVREIAGPLELDQASGKSEIRAIDGSVRAESRSGAVAITDVRGDCLARTRSGDLIVRRVGGEARLNGASGSIRVEEVQGNLTAGTASGSVEARRVRGDARIETASGSIRLDDCGRAARMKAVSGSVDFRGAVFAPLAAETVSGSIRLTIDPSRPLFLDAQTMSGSVRSELPPRGGEPPAGDAPSVRLRSVSGSIRISAGESGQPSDRSLAVRPSGSVATTDL